MTNGTNKLNFKESTAMATSSMHEAESFCSAEDFLDNEPHSPTDSSEDSVEVKISAITFNHKKRKLIIGDNRKEFSGPLKKRMCLKVKADEEKESAKLNNRNKLRGNEEITPFRPWSPPKNGSTNFAVPHQPSSSSSSVKLESSSSGAFAYFRPPSPQQRNNNNDDDQPVSLVVKREDLLEEKIIKDIRVPVHPEITTLTAAETERMILKTNEQFPGLNNNNSNNNMSSSSSSTTSTSFNPLNNKKQDATTKREQRNYKNMTRERRIEANARERTRVHTISAAFDTLRHAVPAYSHNQKLSKLSVLRIACSYIMTLSSLVHDDDDDDNEEIISNNNMEPSTAECVDLVSKTIQKEGKLRKKKDDND